MLRDDDVVGDKVKAPVPLVSRRVPEEKTMSGSGHKFMGNSGEGVEIVGTPKDAEVHVGGGGVEEDKGSGLINRLRGEAVKKIGGSV